MRKALQAIRGMNDILPEAIPYWQSVEGILKHVASRYGYQEIRFPMVEPTELFVRSIGALTDIVEKEMYTFPDRNQDSLTLRPEGTAGCVRACIEHGLLHHQTQRLWYLGSMFRHERPQKGRYRQFYQFGVEALGFSGPDLDAEIIALAARLFKALGLENHVVLELNSLGTPATRLRHREALIAHFEKAGEALNTENKQRLYKNPLRILDSKDPAVQKIKEDAPRLSQYWDETSRMHFEQVCTILDTLQIPYVINPWLVRGLDYYYHTVFEWTTQDLGAQSTVLAGGRYDGLVEHLGGQATPAVGFAMGLERVIELFTVHNKDAKISNPVDACLILLDTAAQKAGIKVAERLRSLLPQLRLVTQCGPGGVKSQFKQAGQSGATWAVILGESELAQNVFTLKNLIHQTEQRGLTEAALVHALS